MPPKVKNKPATEKPAFSRNGNGEIRTIPIKQDFASCQRIFIKRIRMWNATLQSEAPDHTYTPFSDDLHPAYRPKVV
ncbi:hypothetical protein [Morococcus cerebrosus]|uniref:hypothetical protein n=1 Tax=Morococcus cerebrosus TaxID=1056807 RepID=UPI001EFA162F|nr:hypothetical protein [Morococcus cerebrosus]